MDASSVIDFWTGAEAEGLEVCIDGGWAVDAVLETQTRPHGDLDIALPKDRVPALRAMLAKQKFREVPRPDSWEHNFVLKDPQGRLIDVHSYVLNADGSSRAGVPYIADHLCGSGVILGTLVRCVPPRWLVQFHTGYAVDDTDYQDVRRLCDRFELDLSAGVRALCPDRRRQLGDSLGATGKPVRLPARNTLRSGCCRG